MREPEFVTVLFVKLYIVYNKWRRETFFSFYFKWVKYETIFKKSSQKARITITCIKVYGVSMHCRLEYRLNDRYFKYSTLRYGKIDFINAFSN